MAHYVAEQILAAESASDNDRAAKEQAAAESIFALWERRSGLPAAHQPMHAFEQVFQGLHRLSGEDPWSFYSTFSGHVEPSAGDIASNVLLRLALNLENSAREIVRTLVIEAAALSLERESEWVSLSESLDEDDESEAVRWLQQLVGESAAQQPAEAGDAKPLERALAGITRIVGDLTIISDAISQELRDSR
jgi:hypothetical protein